MTWAEEYAKGRSAQVEQQRIANLIAVSECFGASHAARNWAIAEALRSLGFDPESAEPSHIDHQDDPRPFDPRPGGK